MSSFVQGEKSRRRKAINNVTVFNSTLKTVVTSEPTRTKNCEGETFLKVLPRLDVRGNIIMADALNSHLAVSAAILDQGADYLVYIKKNGSKELRSHLEGGNREYAKQEKSCTLIRENIEKEHGRIDETIIKVLSASELSERINCRHQGIRSIVRHTKLSTKIINGQLVHLGLLEHRATLQPP